MKHHDEWKDLFREWKAFRAKTVYERAKLTAASGRWSRLDLSPAHVLELLDRCPVLYREAWVPTPNKASSFALDGFTVGDGWFCILDALSAKLAMDKALHVVQVKEKFGRLAVHCARDEGARVDRRLDARLHIALGKARDRSMRTCEICGKPGTCEERAGWVTVRCEPCLRLDEMARACRRIADRTKGLDFTAFSADKNTQDAVRLALVNIGHASIGQSPRSRARLPDIDWKNLCRFKDVEAVMRIATEQLWEFATKDAPELQKKLR
jgi:uncharacterized protein with HEPN domain